MTETESGCSEPIERCFEGLQALDVFVDTTLLGLDHAAEATGWLEVNRQLAELGGRAIRDGDAGFETAKKRSETLETFAKRERSLGHPYLYGIAVVRIWTILETLADDLVLMRFRAGKYNLDSDVVAAIKVPLREILGVDSDKQAEVVLGELKQATRARL